tara:strand:+ start:655 stop:1047 length:393 start_codon:yes stop_codon:yes gene_type:complete
MKNLTKYFEQDLTTDLVFDNRVKNLLMDGGQIVFSKVGTNKRNRTHFVALVRMPKGKWIADTRPENKGNEFEYQMIENLHHDCFSHKDIVENPKLSNSHNKVVIISSHNEHIRVMKRATKARYYESRHNI